MLYLTPTEQMRAGRSGELVDMRREQFPQTGKSRVLFEGGSRVAGCAWHVLDIHRVTARHRLIPEGAERLQVSLERHQIEAPPELVAVGAPFQREKICNEFVELAIGDVDVGISQQRR